MYKKTFQKFHWNQDKVSSLLKDILHQKDIKNKTKNRRRNKIERNEGHFFSYVNSDDSKLYFNKDKKQLKTQIEYLILLKLTFLFIYFA